MKKTINNIISKIKLDQVYLSKGKDYLNDPHYLEVKAKSVMELAKRPYRYEIINYLLSLSKKPTNYLEIGICNPDHNFNNIKATNKFGVDPGLEYKPNPVDFKMTSDTFFKQLSKGEILSPDIKFDVIFIDGLHVAEQVDMDIKNSLGYISEEGFIVLHDCNPPTEWHAREYYRYWHTPANRIWNGTTWKAFLKWRCNPLVNSCCIDTDWGVGILSKNQRIGEHSFLENPFYEFNILNTHRKESLNLIDFETFKAFDLKMV